MSISTNEYTGKHAPRRGNSILNSTNFIYKNIFIVDAKVKELVYSGNTVFFLLPSRECMRENNFFWSPSQSMTICSISFNLILEITFLHSFTTIIINVKVSCRTSFPQN